ncbi:RND family efflux transporter, MFP subunit [Selenomonas ruminantium]|uniref:RND family efflux transporter, MFP subunit n=2 Tax=Selenomonas ruminantium TaxID=971 RepID=A0A1M6SXG6_SELRU|nr:RND family efflux transporter, MFP subunit [Selenomonas ruminantium]
MVRKWRFNRYVAGGVLAAVCLLGGVFFSLDDGEAEDVKPQSVLSVSTRRAVVSEQQQGLHLTGTVEGLTSAIISSRYSGTVESLTVENGQQVQAGTPLLRTDSQELANNVRMAENGVHKATVSHDNIAVNLQRQQSLYETGATSRQNLDAAQTQWATSRTEMDDAAANLAIAQKRLADATVTSPVTGVVANKNVTLGQMVSAGTQLMTVEQIDAVYVTVQVEQQDIDKVQIGKDATVKVDTYKDKTFAGKVAVINPVAGRDNRLFMVKIRVENPGFELMPGMFAEVLLADEEAKPVLTVPRSAMTSRKGQNYVFVVSDEGKAQQVSVEPGALYDENLEIKSGLSEGALVITDNLDKLKDGDMVNAYGGEK